MKFVAALLQVCTALALAACGGGGLSVALPGGGGKALELAFPPGRAVEHRLPFRISGGIRPYESSIEGCPEWVTLSPDQGILAGTAPVAENDRTLFCDYSVTESDPGFRTARTEKYLLRLTVGPLDRGHGVSAPARSSPEDLAFCPSPELAPRSPHCPMRTVEKQARIPTNCSTVPTFPSWNSTPSRVDSRSFTRLRFRSSAPPTRTVIWSALRV